MHLMQQSLIGGRRRTAEGTEAAKPDGGYGVNVAVVYEDELTRQWGGQVRRRLGEVVGEEAVHCTEWKVTDLGEPRVYSDGVRALARADMIVVSLDEAERLPPAFYLWVNLWLQVRAGLPGALVALVVPEDGSTLAVNETRRYLRAVASQGGLEYLESNHPGAPSCNLRVDGFQWLAAA